MAKKIYKYVNIIQGNKITKEEYDTLDAEDKFEYEELKRASSARHTSQTDMEIE